MLPPLPLPPAQVRAEFLDWYEGYKAQVLTPKPAGAGISEAELMVIFNRIVDRLILLSKQKYNFQSRHEGIDSPYDYFEFGQEYVRPLVDFDNSYVRNMHYWEEANDALERGENVVRAHSRARLPLCMGCCERPRCTLDGILAAAVAGDVCQPPNGGGCRLHPALLRGA